MGAKLRDVTDPDYARAILQAAIPDNIQRACALRQLADSIRVANTLHPGSWSVTLGDWGIRYNIGLIEVITFSPYSGLFAMTELDVSSENWVEILLEEDLAFEVLGDYRAVASITRLILSADEFCRSLPLMKQFHEDALIIATKKVKTLARYRKSHSSGVMKLLRLDVDPTLPDPDYGPNG